VQEQISIRLGLFELADAVALPESVQDRADLIVDPALLELINHMDRQPEIDLQSETAELEEELIEPSVSFFFPKEISNQNYDFEDPTDSGVCSSFFFPKEMPPEIVRPPTPLGKVQKVVSFLIFFVLFVGAEIIGMEMFHRSNQPQIDVGSSQLPSIFVK
jgi:hypothetical protein